MKAKSEQKTPMAKMRERAGLTQSELAQLVGVSENTIANWEKGTASKWIRNLNRLCSTLHCELKDLDPERAGTPPITPEPLGEGSLDTIKSYCAALMEHDKKAAAKIASFATLHDRALRYWLDHADSMLKQFQEARPSLSSCETVINALILQNLLMQLGGLPPNEVSRGRFQQLVQQVQLNPEFLEQYVGFGEGSYLRRLILQTWSLTVYVIGWRPGHSVPMHHHGSSLDAIRVIRGTMTHWLLPPEDCERAGIPYEGKVAGEKPLGSSRIYGPGEVITIDRRCAHRIANCGDEELVTLHFRFGTPPDDALWEENGYDQLVFVLNQEEQCYLRMP